MPELRVLLQQEEISPCTSHRASDRSICGHLCCLLQVAISGRLKVLSLWCWALACVWTAWPESDASAPSLTEVGQGRPQVLSKQYCHSSRFTAVPAVCRHQGDLQLPRGRKKGWVKGNGITASSAAAAVWDCLAARQLRTKRAG